jgi:hypothetical protein
MRNAKPPPQSSGSPAPLSRKTSCNRILERFPLVECLEGLSVFFLPFRVVCPIGAWRLHRPRFSTRRAANLALEYLQKQHIDEPFHREAALNALLLLHEAAKAAHDTPVAIAALEEAGALVDKEAAPLLWAEIHEPLVVFLLEHAKLDRADDSQKDITTRKIHDSSRTRAPTSRL